MKGTYRVVFYRNAKDTYVSADFVEATSHREAEVAIQDAYGICSSYITSIVLWRKA